MKHRTVTTILAGWVAGTAGAQIYILLLALAGIDLSAVEAAGIMVWWGLTGLLASVIALLCRKV